MEQKTTHSLTTERVMNASPEVIYEAWTEKIDHWFAAPGTVWMKPEANTPFYFETHYEGQRHPHYGRFLKLVPGRLVELTWVTGAGGTKGAETIVRVELDVQEAGTHLKLVHAGFMDEDSRNQHAQAWPLVLAQLDEKTAD